MPPVALREIWLELIDRRPRLTGRLYRACSNRKNRRSLRAAAALTPRKDGSSSSSGFVPRDSNRVRPPHKMAPPSTAVSYPHNLAPIPSPRHTLPMEVSNPRRRLAARGLLGRVVARATCHLTTPCVNFLRISLSSKPRPNLQTAFCRYGLKLLPLLGIVIICFATRGLESTVFFHRRGVNHHV